MDDSNPASSLVEPNVKLEKNGEEEKVDVTLFKKIVGSLRYLCNSRPDIGFIVRLVRRYMSEPRVSHMKAARRILRYLKGSINCGILFQRNRGDKETIVILKKYYHSYYIILLNFKKKFKFQKII